MNPYTAEHPPRASLVPIPRNGLRGSSGTMLFLMLILALSTVGIGLSTPFITTPTALTVAEWITGASAVILILHLWRVAGRAKGIFPILILTALLIAYLSSSVIPAATLIALIAAVSLGALVLSVMTAKQMTWAPLPLILAYAITLAVCRDAVAAITCLLPLPAAWALSFATRRSAERENGPTRVGVICATSLALALSVVALISLFLYRALGSLSPATLTAALDAVREQAITWFTSLELPAEATDEIRALFSRENAEIMVNAAINLLPGYLIATVNVLVAIAQLLFQASLVSFGCGASLTDRVRVFRMSAISCVVFTAAYLLTIIGNSETSTLWGTVAHNVYVVLLPGLAFAGLLRLLAGISRHRTGCFSLLLLLFTPLLLILIPLVPAAVEVIGRGASFLASKLRPPEDGDPTGTPPEERP